MGWPLAFYPYIKNGGVFICPSDENPKLLWSDNGTANPYQNTWGKPFPMSYGENAVIYLRSSPLAVTKTLTSPEPS